MTHYTLPALVWGGPLLLLLLLGGMSLTSAGATNSRAAAGAATKPPVLVLILDDWGWSAAGFRRTPQDDPNHEWVTPNIDKLAQTGINLNRYYSYKICSPSRSSFQSGRLAVHVNTENAAPEVRNKSDPVSGFAGIPRNMTGIAAKMTQAGYTSYMTGKWDAGMATQDHTPIGRGYEGGWLGYFHHANDYYTYGLPITATGNINVCLNRFTDLWGPGDGPASSYAGHGTYEEEIFLNHSLTVLEQHDRDAQGPPFLVHSFHLCHTPLEIPKMWLNNFSRIDEDRRQHFAAMTNYMDDMVGQLVDKFNEKNPDGLIVMFSDNGGAIYSPAGGNNWPLRGGKYSDWEGGTRVTAIVAGGAVPSSKRGVTADNYVSVADWYRTFCGLAGVNPDDTRAKAAGLPPVDGMDISGLLVGGDKPLGPGEDDRELHLSSQALISGRYKIITGVQPMTGWTGPSYPNKTGPVPSFLPKGWKYDTGAGELYDIVADPTEHNNIADEYPHVLKTLQARLQELNANNFNPGRGSGDPAACAKAKQDYGGFYGPWVE